MPRKVLYNQELIARAVASADRHPTPFMLTDLQTIVDNCRRFSDAMPNVQLLYAVKAFCTSKVIRAVEHYIHGFDVASIGEIQLLIDNGIDASRLYYSNPVKSEHHCRQAYKLGVRKFAFQSKNELDKLRDISTDCVVYVRMDVGDTKSYVPLSDKFGCSEADAMDLLVYATQLGFQEVGITFHVGSQLLDVTAWSDAISSAVLVAESVRAFGVSVRFINIGGGFAAEYYDTDPKINDSAAYVNKALQEDPDIAFTAEPGRYIVANSSVIVSSVIGVEQRAGKTWVYLDVGKFQAFLGADRYAHFPYKPLVISSDGTERHSEEHEHVTLTGPSCDSQDIIVKDTLLPAHIEVGDKLIFPNTGAYTLVYGSEFNGFPIPEVYYI